jgi:hypothetical protein
MNEIAKRLEQGYQQASAAESHAGHVHNHAHDHDDDEE